jgi:hypothetical protein
MARVSRKRFPPDSVCKPCWELKYCPYGELVEFFPAPGGRLTPEEVKASFQEVMDKLLAGKCTDEEDVWEAVEQLQQRAPWMAEEIREYDPEEIACKIFGHACPVFFVQSGATETKESRRIGDRYISREIMLKVVRRDNHVCQQCFTYVRDDEVEFDHTIPVSRGGATSVENIKLYCRPCNRKKSNTLNHLLQE